MRIIIGNILILDSVYLNCIRNVVGVINAYYSVSFKIDRSVCVCETSPACYRTS